MITEEQAAETLADALKEYYSAYEVDDICSNAGISVDYRGSEPDYHKFALKLSSKAYQEPIQNFLRQICSDLIVRVQEKMELASAEDVIFHQQMQDQIQEHLHYLLDKPIVLDSVRTDESGYLDTLQKVQDFFKTAKGNMIIVDPYIDPRSLACFWWVKNRVRYLTRSDTIGTRSVLDDALEICRNKGIQIAVRCHTTIEDHYISFNDRCWIADTSLHEIHKKPLNLIEINDYAKMILNDIARKWEDAEALV